MEAALMMEAPPVSAYWAVKIAEVPEPEAGETDVTEARVADGEDRRSSQPVLEAALDDCIGETRGKLDELVCPPTKILANLSSAMEFAESDPEPP